jgi:hypothetical protein
MSAIEEYAHYHLSASLRSGKIKLAATSVTDAHKDKVFKTWQKLGAKDIVCTPIENPKELPQWQVEYMTRGKYPYYKTEVAASSRDAVEQYIKKLVKDKWCHITKCELSPH